MKILFLGQRYTYFRNFDSVLRELDSRGHAIHLAVERENDEGRPLIEALRADCPNITFGEAPGRADDDWSWAVSRLRHGLDHLRYQHRVYDVAPKLRDRSRERTPGAFVTLGDRIRRYAPWARGPFSATVRWLERSVPDDPAIRAFVESERPDLVLLTPLITLGSSQIDYLRAARTLGIPTAMCVWSWDHLSSKALIRDVPDKVFVWNDTQKHEAMALHRVSPDRIVVTGAQCFDQWFGREPSRDRETFCRHVGLPSDRPFILYVGSVTILGTEPEAPFVATWIDRLRNCDSPRLRDVPVLVRPHPSRQAEWASVDLSRYRDVSLWGGSSPVDARSRADYFDSLYHSAVVVGMNTSAFIEAGILGRPVLTIVRPEWNESQAGTLHFRYLLEVGGGLLVSAASLTEHLHQLDDVLVNPTPEVKPFIREFVRPHGFEVPATPLFVRHVEALETVRPQPLRAPRLEWLARRMLLKALPWRYDERRERDVYSERELEGLARIRAARQAKAQHERDHKNRRALRKEAREAARQADLERHRAAKKTKPSAAGSMR